MENKNKKGVLFRLEEDLQKQLRIYVAKNDTTIQEIFENYTKQLVKN